MRHFANNLNTRLRLVDTDLSLCHSLRNRLTIANNSSATEFGKDAQSAELNS
jgi:hypothetical protein